MEQSNAVEQINRRRYSKPSSQVEQIRQLWSEIKAAYEAGETLKAIHAQLDGSRFRMSYHNFLSYVSRVRREEELKNPNPNPNPSPTPTAESNCDAQGRTSGPKPVEEQINSEVVSIPAPIGKNGNGPEPCSVRVDALDLEQLVVQKIAERVLERIGSKLLNPIEASDASAKEELRVMLDRFQMIVDQFRKLQKVTWMDLTPIVLCMLAAFALGIVVALPEKIQLMVLLAMMTSMRIGEILGLRWGRVDLKHGFIHVSESCYRGNFSAVKTRRSERRTPLSPTVLRALHVWKEKRGGGPDDLLFASRNGKPLSDKNLLARYIYPACDAIKMPRVSWHMFRHLHGTLLSQLGVPVAVAQAQLGHADPRITLMIYTHVLPDAQMDAVTRLERHLLDPNGPKLLLEPVRLMRSWWELAEETGLKKWARPGSNR